MRSLKIRNFVLVSFFAAIASLIIREQIDARPLAYEEYSQSRLQDHLDSGHCVLITLYGNWTPTTTIYDHRKPTEPLVLRDLVSESELTEAICRFGR